MTDRHEWERLDLIKRQRSFQESVQPIIKLKADFYAMRLPKILLHKDGLMETIWECTDEEKKMLKDTDEMILAMARAYGLEELKHKGSA